MEIRVRYALILLLAVMIIGLISIYLRHSYLTIMEGYQLRVTGVSSRIESHLASCTQSLQVITIDDDIQSLDPRRARPKLVRVAQYFGYFNMGMFAADGTYITGLDNIHPLKATDPVSFKLAIGGIPTISDRITRRGLDKVFFSIRVPIYDNSSEPKAVLSAGISARELARAFDHDFLPVEHDLFVLDKRGQLVYHSRYGDISGVEASYRDIGQLLSAVSSGRAVWSCPVDGKDKVFMHTTMSTSGWRVVAAVPVTDIYAALFRQVIGTLLAFFFPAALSGMLYASLRKSTRYRRQLELERLERSSTVTQMAAAIAHEIRNPLTAIKGFIQLIMRQPAQPPPTSYLETVLTEIDRIDQLTNEFRLFAKPAGMTVKAKVDLARNINEVAALMEPQALGKNIVLSFSLAVECQVYGSANQLKQVWINLIRNAIEAVPFGGRVEVALKVSGNKAVVTIADNGPGIPAATLADLGKPFFTTKEQGTGLGLAVCFNIIRNHGGLIEVSSPPGQGAIFLIYLPLLDIVTT